MTKPYEFAPGICVIRTPSRGGSEDLFLVGFAFRSKKEAEEFAKAHGAE